MKHKKGQGGEAMYKGGRRKEREKKGHTFPLKLEKLATDEKRGKEGSKGKLAVVTQKIEEQNMLRYKS